MLQFIESTQKMRRGSFAQSPSADHSGSQDLMQISLKKLFTPLSRMPSYPGAYNCVGFLITPQMNFTFLHSCPSAPFLHSLWPGFRFATHSNPGLSCPEICPLFPWLLTPSHPGVIHLQLWARVITPGA